MNEITRVNELLSQNPESQEFQENLRILHNTYEIVSIHKTREAEIRSRIKYIEEGERNTKYFLSMEKVRGGQNTI